MMDENHNVKQFYLEQIKTILARKNISLIEDNEQQQQQTHVTEKSNSNENCSKRKIEVVVFKDKNSKSSKTKLNKKSLPTTSSITEDQKLLKAKNLLKEIEWDVTSFGLKGFSLDEKRKMEQERAIRLGAKPRKQKYINYKVRLCLHKFIFGFVLLAKI